MVDRITRLTIFRKKKIMKKRLSLLLILLLASSTGAWALEGHVISDSKTKTQVQDAFDGLNSYTDNFFTSNMKKRNTEVMPNAKMGDPFMLTNPSGGSERQGSMLPIPKLKLMIQKQKELKAQGKDKSKEKDLTVTEEVVPLKDQAVLDCDVMEYHADKTELEATGNVVIVFPQNNSTVKADRVVYNQTSNLIKAFGHVILVSEGKELTGDYMQIDMNEEVSFMNNPTSDIFQIRVRSKTGYMYGDKIIQEQGSIMVTKKTMINLRNEYAGPDLTTMYIPEDKKSYYKKDAHGEKFRIKTNDIIINSKKEHDTVTLKHAELYFNEKKVGTVPTITIHTNKARDYVEANYPEFGTKMNLGMYAGPGFVFDTPMGTNLKIVPFINYGTGDNKQLGFGGLARLASATNKVEAVYGTSNKMFLLRGKQRLDDNMYIQYGHNSFMDDWFMGYRMPRLMGEVVYENDYLHENFLAKDKNMIFSHRIAGAYIQDGNVTPDQGPLGSDGVGTMRFKYMAQIAQTLYTFGTSKESTNGVMGNVLGFAPNSWINGSLSMVGQASTAMYGTGDTQLVARIGPMLHTQYKNWMQDVGYFLSAYNDKTPLVNFDRYMYGRSNTYIRETFRLNKYMALSWFGSLNLMQDSWDGKMLQENGFYFALGPDDAKLHIGYDTVREQMFMGLALNLDAKGTVIDYKKMVIKNPDTLGKNKNGENNHAVNNSSFAPSSVDDDGNERAEVVEIQSAL